MYYGYEPKMNIQTRESLGPKSGTGFQNERGDLINNRVGFMLREKYGDDERAAMDELMRMIARNDDSLNYWQGSNINKDPLIHKEENLFVFGGLAMLSRKHLMRELTRTLNRRKKYGKDNMGNEIESI